MRADRGFGGWWRFGSRARAATLMGVAALADLGSTAAHAQVQLPGTHPLSYMTGFGYKNYPVVALLWGLIIIMLIVVTTVGLLVLVGSLRRKWTPIGGKLETVPVERAGRGMEFIYIGIGLTVATLIGIAIWDFVVMREIGEPPPVPGPLIRVRAHQWWWEFEYVGSAPDRTFVTADELHIPTGVPVRLQLNSVDVIHSFWVPALTGKTDVVPSMNNQTWMEADVPGIYRGQCQEYCGQQHAHMAFMVVAEPPAAYEAWVDRQLLPPPVPTNPAEASEIAYGETKFLQHCAVCHAVRGTEAGGKVGPNLSHLMERTTLAAGTIPNSVGYLAGWISNPQHIKPGNDMPTLVLSNQELAGIVAFLRSLK